MVATVKKNRSLQRETTTADDLDAGTQVAEQKTQENVYSQALAFLGMAYMTWSLFGMVAWVSHLGARVEFLAPFLPGYGYARNIPVATIKDLFLYNGFAALGFVLPHSFLRPPRLIQYVGLRYARLLYCVIAAATCHFLIAFWRPIDMSAIGNQAFNASYVYDEESNVPLFTLPVPRIAHDVLSFTMLFYTLYCFLEHPNTYIICGYNRARYGKDKFPPGLSPRVDIITWMGYAVWLKAGNLGFILFSGLSILPYKTYTWDLIIRVVAAAYLRARSGGFRLWVGKIEGTHHLIWVIRGGLVLGALGYQYSLLSKNNVEESVTFNKDIMNPTSLAIMLASGIGIGVVMHTLEKIKA